MLTSPLVLQSKPVGPIKKRTFLKWTAKLTKSLLTLYKPLNLVNNYTKSIYEVRNHTGTQESTRSQGGIVPGGMPNCPDPLSESPNCGGILPHTCFHRRSISASWPGGGGQYGIL